MLDWRFRHDARQQEHISEDWRFLLLITFLVAHVDDFAFNFSVLRRHKTSTNEDRASSLSPSQPDLINIIHLSIADDIDEKALIRAADAMTPCRAVSMLSRRVRK